MLDLDEDGALPLRPAGKPLVALNSADDDADAGERLAPLLPSMAPKDLLEDREQLVAVPDTLGVDGETGIRLQIRPSDQPTKRRPLLGEVGGQNDRLDLDTTVVTGNRELPKVLYIVPWKKADLGDLPAQPFNTLLDEVLTPVDRDVFRREVTYYGAVNSASAESAPAPSAPSDGTEK